MLEEKIDLLIAAVEKLTYTLNGQEQLPLPIAPTPKAKGKKQKTKAEKEAIAGYAKVVTTILSETGEAEGVASEGVSFDALKDRIIAVASELDDGRDRVKAIFKKLKVDTAADLKPEQWAECYGLLAKEK